mgnify:CR=1 FL=1
MKFKVGDKVKLNENVKKFEYGRGGVSYDEIGKVTDTSGGIINVDFPTLYDWGGLEKELELVENLTISQLQSEIDKLSNKVQEEYSNVISNRDKVNYLKKQLKQLKEENKKEKNKPILDDEEKEYLSVVIRPFKDKVKYIRKCCTSRGEYIEIGILNDSAILPYFNKNTMYKGMELEKQYTLKELGLDE